MKLILIILTLGCSSFLYAQPTDTTKGLGLKKKADPKATTGKTYALITGISSYQDNTTYTNLQYADDDARGFYDYMVSKKGGKADPVNVDTIFNEQASFWVFWKKFNRIKDMLQPNDMFYIFFSGHGDAYRADEAYLLAYDAPAGNDRNNYSTGVGLIDIHKLKIRIEELTSKGVNVMLITDACRTNELPGKEEGRKQAYQQIFERKAGEIQLISCGTNEVSFEGYQWGGGHGLFSWHLLNGLKGMADTRPQNGKVTVTELFRYVSDQVSAASYDKKEERSLQTPQYCCSTNDAIVLSEVDPEERKKLEQQLALDATVDAWGVKMNPGKGTNLGIEMKNAGYEDLYKEFLKAMNEGRLIEPGGAYDILRRILVQKDITKQLSEELKFELSSRLMTDVAKVINTYLHAAQNNNKYTYNYFIKAANKLAVFREIGDTQYYNPVDARVNQLFLEGHANWRSTKTHELKYCLLKVDSAVALKPQAAYLYNLKGLMHLKLHQYPEAERALRAGIALAPNWLYPYHNLGCTYMENRNYDSALIYFNKALSIDTNYQTTYSILSELYSRQSEHEKAVEYARIGSMKDPTDPYLHVQLGYYHYRKGNLDSAMYSFQNSIRADSTLWNGYEGALQVHLKRQMDGKGEPGTLDSISHYAQRMIATDSTNPVVYQNLGWMFYQLKVYDNAISVFELSLEYDSLNASTWHWIGDTYVAMAKDTQAINNYWRSADLDSTGAAIFNKLGLAYYRLGMHSDALIVLNRSINIEPKNEVYYYNYAYISAQNRDTATAELYYEKTLKVNRHYASASYEWARLRAFNGKKEKAVELLKDAIRDGYVITKKDLMNDTAFRLLLNNKEFLEVVNKLKP